MVRAWQKWNALQWVLGSGCDSRLEPWGLSHRVDDRAQVLGAFRHMWKERFTSVRAKMRMYEGTVILTVPYGCKVWTINVKRK